MAGFQEVVQKATARLKRDRELRMEVSRELENHLDDAFAEFCAADYSEEDAFDAARKAFGPPEDIADQLWACNRFRLKLRAWAWWVARLALIPACLVAVGVFVVSGMTGFSMWSVNTGAESSSGIRGWVEARRKAQMTESQRLIFYGDESAENDIDRWRGLRDAYPEEVLYQLELVAQMRSEIDARPWRHPSPTPETLAKAQALRSELERAETIDPRNGIYALIDAGLSAMAIELDPDDESLVVEPAVVRTLDRDGEGQERTESEVQRFPKGTDSVAVRRVMVSLAEAADRPYLSMHEMDRAARRLDQLPPPDSMQSYLMQASEAISTSLPCWGLPRRVARVACAEAMRLAEAGDVEEAISVLDDLHAVNARMGASSDTLIMLMVAWSMEALQRTTRVAVWEILGDDAKAAEALGARDELVMFWRQEWNAHEPSRELEEELMQTGGVFLSLLAPVVPGYDVDPTPFRKAEYTLLDRGALTLGMLLLVAVACVAGGVGGLNALRRRDDGAAVLMWIGWRRLGWVLGAAVGLPVLGFVLWSWTPWSGRGFGVNHRPAGAFLSYVPLLTAVMGLLLVLGAVALRQRARELGMTVTPGYLGLAARLPLVIVGHPGPVEQRRFRRSALRSFPPIFCAACLLLALVVGWSLDRREAELARQLVADSPMLIGNEIQRSQGKVLAAYLAGDLERPPRRR